MSWSHIISMKGQVDSCSLSLFFRLSHDQQASNLAHVDWYHWDVFLITRVVLATIPPDPVVVLTPSAFQVYTFQEFHSISEIFSGIYLLSKAC